MKRFAVAALVIVLAVPLTALGAAADIAHAKGVATSSKGWVVTLTIAKWSMRTGSSMSATLTIVNRTGHDVKVESCESDATFTVGIGNAKVPYAPISGAVGCRTTLHKGANVFHDRIDATYQICSESGSQPTCGTGPMMPKLPTGLYHTVVEWPTSPPFITKPGTLWVTVTK